MGGPEDILGDHVAKKLSLKGPLGAPCAGLRFWPAISKRYALDPGTSHFLYSDKETILSH